MSLNQAPTRVSCQSIIAYKYSHIHITSIKYIASEIITTDRLRLPAHAVVFGHVQLSAFVLGTHTCRQNKPERVGCDSRCQNQKYQLPEHDTLYGAAFGGRA